YYVEWLTNELESRAWKEFEKIDKMGGSMAAIENGYMSNAITEAAFRFQRRVEKSEQVVVGVNKFAQNEKRSMQILRISDARDKQVAKLATLKESRDNEKVAGTLAVLKQSAIDGTNVMPFIVAAVEVSATLGEICNVLRDVYGEQKQSFI
ncbi:MAG TPA: methylmalonyl-CoA mutase family protein, partial [Chloroflexota bacterium]|nr:methylmalonyl-CoA mutase family protein [Chloroflexota bacterium]